MNSSNEGTSSSTDGKTQADSEELRKVHSIYAVAGEAIDKLHVRGKQLDRIAEQTEYHNGEQLLDRSDNGLDNPYWKIFKISLMTLMFIVSLYVIFDGTNQQAVYS